MASVTLSDVKKSYGKAEVIFGIDIDIADGEFVVLVGPSGCGKSTLLRMLAGLETITGGTIEIGDSVVNDLEPKDRDIAMVFQNYALYPHMTVAANMGFSLEHRRVPKATIAERVQWAAGILGLEPYLERYPRQLSGGQRQRVAMGRAIVRNPDVFLFDEPLSNLDAKLRMQMRTEIKKLHAKVKSTVIYVTHDQVEAMTLADRIVIMRDGHIEQVGPPEEVFRRPASRFVAGFIGSPTMNLRDAVVGDGKLIFGNGDTLPLPQQFRDRVTAGQKVTFGLRPDDVYPTGHGIHSGEAAEVHAVEVPVSLTEPLGNETLVFAEFAGEDWISRMLNPKTLRMGDRINLSFDLSQSHLFDAATEKSLRS